MRVRIPGPLEEVARLLSAPSPARRHQGFGVPGGEWTIQPAFRGFSDPPPGPEYCFGKRSSCLRDSAGRMSCAEVEITRRLRRAGWRGGWINTYGGDPPARWLGWTTTVGELAALMPERRNAFAGWLLESVASGSRSGGTPDIVVVRGEDVLALECKRQPDGRSRGDLARATQETWTRSVVAGLRLLAPEEFGVVWWTRAPAPRTSPSITPENEPTRRQPDRGARRAIGATRDRMGINANPRPPRRPGAGSSQRVDVQA